MKKSSFLFLLLLIKAFTVVLIKPYTPIISFETNTRINCAKISPSGKYLAYTQGQKIYIQKLVLNKNTKKNRFELQNFKTIDADSKILDLAFSDNDTYFAYLSFNKLKIFGKKEVKQIEKDKSNFLFLGTKKKKPKISFKTEYVNITNIKNNYFTNSLTFHPTNKILAVGSYNKKILFIDFEKNIQTQQANAIGASKLCFIDQSHLLSFNKNEKLIQIIDLTNFKNPKKYFLQEEEIIHCFDFFSNTNTIFYTTEDKKIRKATLSNKEQAKIVKEINSKIDPIQNISIGKNPYTENHIIAVVYSSLYQGKLILFAC